MRVLRIIILLPLAALSVFFLIGYARALYPMYQMIDDPGLVFLQEPYVGYYPSTHSHDERAHWELFKIAGGHGEGTSVVHCFPDWTLALAAMGVLAYSPFAILRRRPNPMLEPI